MCRAGTQCQMPLQTASSAPSLQLLLFSFPDAWFLHQGFNHPCSEEAPGDSQPYRHKIFCILFASHQQPGPKQNRLLTKPAIHAFLLSLLLKGRQEAVSLQSHLRLSSFPAPFKEGQVAVFCTNSTWHTVVQGRHSQQRSFQLHCPEGKVITPPYLNKVFPCTLWFYIYMPCGQESW